MVKQVSYITDAMHQKNPTVVGFVSEVGQITQDTNKNGEPYIRQTVTLKDHSGEIKLILWNDECDKLRLNQYYKIDHGWIKEYEGNAQLHIGNYGTLSDATADDMLPIPHTGQTDLDSAMETSDGHVELSPEGLQKVNNIATQQFTGKSSIDVEIETATKVMKAFIQACKDTGAEGATLNAASVFNTVLINEAKKHG